MQRDTQRQALLPRPFGCIGGVFAAIGGALLLFLVIGLLLPHTWSATATRVVEAQPDDLFALLDDPRAWERWTPAGDLAFRYDGPQRGAGAQRSWDDPRYGQGSFEIVESTPPRAVAYRVTVQETLVTSGRVELDPVPGGTQVTWTEQGDFGWNPLLGYQAMWMARSQGALMEGSLQRLDSLARATPPVEEAPDRANDAGRAAAPSPGPPDGSGGAP